MSYCPGCLSNSLSMNNHGVIHLVINDKQMNTNRLLFKTDERSKILDDIKSKIVEHFKWYSNFKNKEPVKKIELWSTDVYCENKCKLPLNSKYSIIDILVPSKEIKLIVLEIGKKYEIPIEVQSLC